MPMTLMNHDDVVGDGSDKGYGFCGFWAPMFHWSPFLVEVVGGPIRPPTTSGIFNF